MNRFRQRADHLQDLRRTDHALVDDVMGELGSTPFVCLRIPRRSVRENQEHPNRTGVDPGLHDELDVAQGAEQVE